MAPPITAFGAEPNLAMQSFLDRGQKWRKYLKIPPPKNSCLSDKLKIQERRFFELFLRDNEKKSENNENFYLNPVT